MDGVQPWEILGEARTPDGALMTLTRRDREFFLLADGKSLMTSAMRGSEEELSALGCVRSRKLQSPCALVGGLGMGFTLRAMLDQLPAKATVVVAELMPAVVEWNRVHLGQLTQHPLRDPRVQVDVRDVAEVMRSSPGTFDTIVLDVDNGPTAFTTSANNSLYDNEGVALGKAALRPNGVYCVWSAWDDRRFEHRLRHYGFTTSTHHVRARLKKGGPMHTIFRGMLESDPEE